MRLFFAKIFIIVSSICLLGHNLIPHHHHEIVTTSHHHHDSNGHDENADHHKHILSFGHLDDSFTLSQISYDTHLDFEFVNCKTPFDFEKSIHGYTIVRKVFLEVDESPPPDKYFISSSYRGPPIV